MIARSIEWLIFVRLIVKCCLIINWMDWNRVGSTVVNLSILSCNI